MSMHLALFFNATGCHYAGWRMTGAARPNPTDWLPWVI